MNTTTHTVANHRPTYYKVFGALMVLTGITVAVAKIPAGSISTNTALILAMAIASVKATMVALFFMHLKTEVKPIYIIVGVPLLLTAILVFALMPDISHVH